MIRRDDLQRVITVAETNGFRFRHAAGIDMLLYGATPVPQDRKGTFEPKMIAK